MSQTVRWHRYGRDSILVDVPHAVSVREVHQAVLASGLAHLFSDIVPGARSVLLSGVSTQKFADVVEWLSRLDVAGLPSADEGGVIDVELPIRYDGPDLSGVAEAWQCDEADVINAHQTTVWRVEFCGFVPGFAYCLPEGPRLPSTPRLSSPRPRVPAGAVGLAGRYTAVYPKESPGGWQIIGMCPRPLFDLGWDQPALLVPGVRITWARTD